MIKKYLMLPKFIGKNTFSPKFFMNRLKVMDGYLGKKAILNSFPTAAEIETTSLCNLNCIISFSVRHKETTISNCTTFSLCLFLL